MKKTIEEVKEWLLENRVDENGNLNLIGLDFSDFDGNVYINGMKVKKRLYQHRQTVGTSLYQEEQSVGYDLFQGEQKVERTLYQGNQRVKHTLFQGGSRVVGDYWNTGNKVAGSVNEEEVGWLATEDMTKEELAAYGKIIRGE